MPFITTAEKIGMERGLEQGLQQGLEQGLHQGLELALQLKFGAASAELIPETRQITELAVIRKIYRQVETAATINDIRRLYSSP